MNYIQNNISRGIWSFSSQEMAAEIGFSPKDRLSIYRRNGQIISPARGFHVIVPEEYVHTGRCPVDRYIHALMAFYERPYYVGLLSAASYWGASHQSPMSFHVVTNYDRRNIRIHRNQILFYRKIDMELLPVVQGKTSTGYFNVSSPETTFFDLVQFHRQVGGLDYVAEILSELSEQFSQIGIREAASYYPDAIVQRGAYLLERVGLETYCEILDAYFNGRQYIYTQLNPSENRVREPRQPRWKIIINDELEIES